MRRCREQPCNVFTYSAHSPKKCAERDQKHTLASNKAVARFSPFLNCRRLGLFTVSIMTVKKYIEDVPHGVIQFRNLLATKLVPTFSIAIEIHPEKFSCTNATIKN